MGQMYSTIFPPPAKLTEKNLDDQTGKVFVVTGASTGVGEQLATILYGHNARVYIAARSEENGSKAIKRIEARHPTSKGKLTFIHLDLGDLTTIRKSAETFLSKEERLDVLWLNAGVMVPPKGSKTAQGYELQLGTNCIGHFMFANLLRPILAKTAASSPPNSVRVVWVSSSAVNFAPKNAIDFSNMDYKKDEMAWTKYGRSKAGNVIHSTEFARRAKDEGIISLSLNPGNLASDLQRHVPWWQMALIKATLYPAIQGAYTELYAGLSPDITMDHTGGWVAPWGRLVPGRKDLHEPELGRKYWEWTEEQVKPYL
ncbi:hypothetical protein MMC26_002195 [Xylographa opegraphella]|nr:hypothetical protein [Xylographa opegraphella]